MCVIKSKFFKEQTMTDTQDKDLKDFLDSLVDERLVLRTSFTKKLEQCRKLCKQKERKECGKLLFVLKDKLQRLRTVDNEIKRKSKKVWSFKERKQHIEQCEEYYEKLLSLEYDYQQLPSKKERLSKKSKYEWLIEDEENDVSGDSPGGDDEDDVEGELPNCTTTTQEETYIKDDQLRFTYQINEEIEDEDSIQKFINWTFVKKFDNKDVAYEYIQNAKIWSFQKRSNARSGLKKYYRCNAVRSKGPQCSAQVFLLLDAYSPAVKLYHSEADHDHHLKPARNYGLSERVKEEIDRLEEIKMKPKAIRQYLAALGDVAVPKLTQIRTYLACRRRRLKYGELYSVEEVLEDEAEVIKGEVEDLEYLEAEQSWI